MIEAFTEVFAQDNPATLDKDRLRRCVKHIVERKTAKKQQ